ILVFLIILPTAQAIPTYDLIVVRADIPTEYVIASVYANYADIPVVLINPDEIPSDIKRELSGYVKSGYKNMLIIGGEEAISLSVENELRAMNFSVKRLWDWNRYGTAARVAVELWIKSGYVVMVDGENYQNLMLAQRYALENDLPLLFIKNFNVPSETKTALEKLEVKKIYLFGEKIEDNLGIKVEVLTPEKIDFEIEETEEEEFNWMFLIVAVFITVILLSIYLLKRRSIPSSVLTGDEKKIIKLVRKGDMQQNQLPAITGFSKPKVSRLLQELESRGIVKRKKLKKTYLLKLKTKVD
ncbi:MAG: hypothetical protein ACETVN_02700, partial [Asgard group archaeon]